MFSIIDNGVLEEYMTLARVWSIFFLLIRCHLCTNEAIESALYAVACTFVGLGVLNIHLFVVILVFQNLQQQKHSHMSS